MGAGQSHEIPKTMRRLVLQEPNADITQAKVVVEEVDMPVPKPGEVLVKVLAAPVNPSDYGEWSHTASPDDLSSRKAIGKEGSGIVVASGGGIYANQVVGSRVGFITNVKGQGSYSEYTTVDALKGIFPLPDSVATEDAASHFVNPYTAYGFIDTVRVRHAASKHSQYKPGFIHTAAASQLGQMLVKLCKQESVTLVNVVRREEQADTLRALGAEIVVVTSNEGWEESLKQIIKEHNIHLAFDAVAGEMSGKILECLPFAGTLFVYGKLAQEGCSHIQPIDLIYRRKKLEGWYLGAWVAAGDSISMLMRIRAATACVHAGLVGDGWATSQFKDCKIENMWENFVDMWKSSGFTGRKLRIRFDAEVASPEEGK
jgi:NADPH:quinone reductase